MAMLRTTQVFNRLRQQAARRYEEVLRRKSAELGGRVEVTVGMKADEKGRDGWYDKLQIALMSEERGVWNLVRDTR